MKKIEWKRGGMHMVIKTGHGLFDRQCEALGTGNIWGTCQFSNYIRAKNDTQCNGFTFPVGHLQTSDLNYYKNLPHLVKVSIKELAETFSVCLSEIRHYYRGKKIIHGYIITRGTENHKLLRIITLRHTEKSQSILRTVAEYISNP